MRRAAVALAGTASGVVLLVSYRASTHPAVEATVVSAAPLAQPTAGPSDVPPPAPPSMAAPAASAAVPTSTTGPGPPVTRAPSRAARSSTAPTPTTAASASAPAVTPQLVTGGVAGTRYGPVQVQITVTGGRLTAARTLEQPSGDGHTDQINAYAVPRLNREALSAQSAHIDAVTGATYTSEGYIGSLQSALDAAHLD